MGLGCHALPEDRLSAADELVVFRCMVLRLSLRVVSGGVVTDALIAVGVSPVLRTSWMEGKSLLSKTGMDRSTK